MTLPAERIRRLGELIDALYGSRAATTLEHLANRLEAFRERHPRKRVAPAERLDQSDAVLITYGDQVRRPGEPPLRTLHTLLRNQLRGTVSGVHLLPFYPYTSDDGFSVVDYRAVDPDLGNWDDVHAIGQDFRLMFDAVINHVSASSAWFRGFLAGEEAYQDHFITESPDTDLSQVVRPRTTPLLTPFETAHGRRHLWTTFSADQIDLNYTSPAVLLEVLEVLLDYIAHGADIIRLDAVTYLWKEVGTSCVHHPKTHAVLKLLRTVVETAAPWVVLLTETNVPHRENVSYFGDGRDEAQMVYNFALPPLTLHTFLAGDARRLQDWARDLATPGPETTFFNFLASHDGIGVRPVEEILGGDEFQRLVAAARRHGGLVSSKTNADGGESPYELNINYFDALNDPGAGEPQELQVRRFMTAQAIMLSLAGVPGIYVHSLLGSRSARDEVERTGRARSINREKFDYDALVRDLARPQGLRAQVLGRFRTLLRERTRHPAFHPQAPQQVLATGPGVFGLRRQASGGAVLCLHNVRTEVQQVPLRVLGRRHFRDLLNGTSIDAGDGISLQPLETRWLAAAVPG